MTSPKDDAKTELQTTTSPEPEGYSLSQRAAEQTRQIVEATAMIIENRRYVSVEGWQAIAIAHGCVASARDVEPVYEGQNLIGYKAVGEIRRMDTGAVIATGEGFIGVDEVIWFGGTRGSKKFWPRPLYACRAMAQTRAISRACRSAFAHVVVIINKDLATTPAEEMENISVYNEDPAPSRPPPDRSAGPPTAETRQPWGSKPTTDNPSMMAEAEYYSRESGYKQGDRFRGQHRKAGAPMTKEEIETKKRGQAIAADEWISEWLPKLKEMTEEERKGWREREDIRPRLDTLEAYEHPGYEHFKPAYERLNRELDNMRSPV